MDRGRLFFFRRSHGKRKCARQILQHIIIEIVESEDTDQAKIKIKPVFGYNKQSVRRDQLIGSLEYLIFKTNKIVLMHTAIEFAIIMTKSLIPIPQTTHKLRPIINTITNHIDTSSVFLVFIDLIIWGILLDTAKTVAIIPIRVTIIVGNAQL